MIVFLRNFKGEVSLNAADDVAFLHFSAYFYGRGDLAKVRVDSVDAVWIFDDDDLI